MKKTIINELKRNRGVFESLLTNKSPEQYLWKPDLTKWCLLEVACHLLDEEKEDFKNRIHCSLEFPGSTPTSIDPQGWVLKRNYLGKDYGDVVKGFIKERTKSITYLESLINVDWSLSCNTSSLGAKSASHFLYNWLAHDYHHIRQVNRINYEYLKAQTEEDLSYAGNW